MTTPVVPVTPPDIDPDTFPGLALNMPAYVDAATFLGGVLTCLVCGTLVGIGHSVEAAAANAIKDGTGSPVADGNGFLCKHHAAGSPN